MLEKAQRWGNYRWYDKFSCEETNGWQTAI